MAENIIVNFSGWCECDPNRIKFLNVSNKDIPEVITGGEWLALPDCDEENEDAACRNDYMLEDSVEAQKTALDGHYDFWDLDVEGE